MERQRLSAKKVGLLRSGVFPDKKEGIIAVRDIPAIVIEVPKDALNFDGPYTELTYAMTTEMADEKGEWIIELELDGAFACDVVVELPEYRELCDEAFRLGLLVIRNQDEESMLLTFLQEDDG